MTLLNFTFTRFSSKRLRRWTLSPVDAYMILNFPEAARTNYRKDFFSFAEKRLGL